MKALKSKNRLSESPRKRNLNNLFEKGKGFIESIKPSENVLLIHHKDVDGYCSGALFLSALKKLGKSKGVEIVAATNDDLQDLMKDKKTKSYDKIIILDIDAPYLKKEYEDFEGKILIIDHHTLRKNLNSEKLIYINPRVEDEERYWPTSYVVYIFLCSIVDLKELEWIAVLGTVADLAFEDCKDLLGKWITATSKNDLVKTEFWQVSKMLYGVIIIETGNVLDMLLKHKDLSELKSDRNLLSADNKFEKEYKKMKNEFWKNAEEINNVIFSKIDPPFKRMSSVLSTNISLENKDKVIILLEKRGDKFKISARVQSGIPHVGKLMEKCCSLNGGGHRTAAGGLIMVSDLEKFKKCIVSNLHNF